MSASGVDMKSLLHTAILINLLQHPRLSFTCQEVSLSSSRIQLKYSLSNVQQICEGFFNNVQIFYPLDYISDMYRFLYLCADS